MSNCSCIYVDCDESFELYRREMVTARKQHKCSECWKVINPKEQYEVATGMYDGYFSRYKTCKDCLSLRETFFCQDSLHTSLYELLNEYLYECSNSITSIELEKLTPRAKNYVINLIDEIWEKQGLWNE